ncbi:hypothetical protein IDJ75_10620 [Mucilaginibacter rigui]|uniref:Uncharacterized protein n=1 Tax=Mucilaginibacter rigui TaxID=534635 RepID=A0ABR7X575_9SPHI|nr:hypothetical protein [Mucilaginibacter rigui]MBD1385732.1 hypothetical protein [Mucilaginibacter rigui]
MPPVLIYTDTQKATEEKAYLTTVIPFLQSAYNAILGLQLTATLAELESLFNSISRNPQGTDHLEQLAKSFVKNKLVIKAGSQDYNGVPISAQKIADMIDVPNVSTLVSALDGYFHARRSAGFGIRFTLLDLVDDVISKKGTADASITTEYTYYSKNDYGAALATQLFTMCDAMNQLEALDTSALSLKVGGLKQDGIFKGVEFINNTWRPSLYFIREREAQKPNA